MLYNVVSKVTLETITKIIKASKVINFRTIFVVVINSTLNFLPPCGLLWNFSWYWRSKQNLVMLCFLILLQPNTKVRLQKIY